MKFKQHNTLHIKWTIGRSFYLPHVPNTCATQHIEMDQLGERFKICLYATSYVPVLSAQFQTLFSRDMVISLITS